MNLEVLVEELSAEQALRILLPQIVGKEVMFEIRSFSGKTDLLKKLPQRLRGYATWVAAADTRIVVLVDRDDDDCVALKAKLEKIAAEAGLSTPSTASDAADVIVVNRIAVEELEAWFFGDVTALHRAYPRVPATLNQQARYRVPDTINGTWEALEHVLQKHGYHAAGLPKTVAAVEIAKHMDVERNRSQSFQAFRDGLRRLVGGGSDA
ncbi:MAG: DUF4276 family protein [Haloechinothrix sp.]